MDHHLMGYKRQTLCGATAPESFVHSNHELKRGRITCTACLIEYPKSLRTQEERHQAWKARVQADIRTAVAHPTLSHLVERKD